MAAAITMNGPAPIPFDDLREFFADEGECGQLCDVLVPDADRRAWSGFLLSVVPRWPYRFGYHRDNEDHDSPEPLPGDPAEVLDRAGSDDGPWPWLQMDLLGMTAVVQFYAPGALELDVRAADITAERYLALAAIMRDAGDAMGHDVFLTPASMSAAAAMVYEAQARAFRRPKHGRGSDGRLRAAMFARLRTALAPVREASAHVEASGDKPLARSVFPDALLAPIVEKVDLIRHAERELRLQDELAPQERMEFDWVWSTLATIVAPAPGSGAGEYRLHYERDLIKQARKLA